MKKKKIYKEKTAKEDLCKSRKSTTTIIILGIATLVIGISLGFIGWHLLPSYYSWGHALRQFRCHILTANLWFEEDDHNYSIGAENPIREKLDEAEWYANALLEGGETDFEVIIPLRDREIRREIQDLNSILIRLGGLLGGEESPSFALMGSGNEYENQIDLIFNEVIKKTDAIEIMLYGEIEAGKENLIYTSFGLLASIGIFCVLATFLSNTFERQMGEAYEVILSSRNQIETHEKWLSAMFRSIDEGLVTTDPEGKILLINKVAEELAGYPGEEAIGKPFEDVFQIRDEESRKTVDNPVTRILDEGVSIGPIRKRILTTRTGIEIPIVKSGAPIYDSQGDVLGTVMVFRDQTEERRVENALRESRDYLDKILNGMFEGVMVIDCNHQILDVNTCFLKQNNISREEVIGRKCFEVTHGRTQPCNGNDSMCPLQDVLNLKVPAKVEHVHHTSEGKELLVEIFCFPIQAYNGEIEAVVEVMHDITERKRAEEQLILEARRSEALASIASRLNTSLDLEAVVGTICEETTQVMNVPIAIFSLYDSERDTFITTRKFSIPSAKQVDIPPISSSFYKEAVQRSEPLVIIPNIQNAQYMPSLDFYTSLDARTMVSAIIQRGERLIGVLSIFTVSEERQFTKDELNLLQGIANQAAIALENARLYQSEHARYQESESLRQATLALTSTMSMDQVLERILAKLQNVVPYDTAAVQLLQDDRLELIAGRGFPNLPDLLGTFFPVEGNLRYGQVLKKKEPITGETGKLDFKTPNDSAREKNAWLGVPLMIGDRLIGIITLSKYQPEFYAKSHGRKAMVFAAAAAVAIENAQLYKDLNDQIQLLKETQNLLVQKEKLAAIGEIVAGIAHELNNPITIILLLAQHLQDENIDKKTQKDLERIVVESLRTAKIVRDLLAFSMQHPPERRLVSLNEILEKTLESVAHEIDMEPIKISTEFSKDLHPVLADPLQLQQVFFNIIYNARQAMMNDPANARLKIITEIGASAFPHNTRKSLVVRISFQDNGPGIHGDVLPRIFDPFFTTKSMGEGTGLGLSICHGIINEHGGHIWAESKPGQGASFFVELPVAQPDTPHPTIPEEQPKQLVPGLNYKILIIDDEASLLEILSRTLKRRGFQVKAVSNGREGLDYLDKTKTDLILCDIRMPEMSGQDLFYHLKKLSPEMLDRILFTTGDTISPETRNFLDETGASCLSKPFELDHLIDVIEKIISDHL